MLRSIRTMPHEHIHTHTYTHEHAHACSSISACDCRLSRTRRLKLQGNARKSWWRQCRGGGYSRNKERFECISTAYTRGNLTRKWLLKRISRGSAQNLSEAMIRNYNNGYVFGPLQFAAAIDWRILIIGACDFTFFSSDSMKTFCEIIKKLQERCSSDSGRAYCGCVIFECQNDNWCGELGKRGKGWACLKCMCYNCYI